MRLRIAVRLVTAVVLTAGLVVGGFTAAPRAWPLLDGAPKQSIAPEILLLARGVDSMSSPAGAHVIRTASTGTAEVCSPILFHSARGDVATNGRRPDRRRLLDEQGTVRHSGGCGGSTPGRPGSRDVRVSAGAAAQLLWTGGRRCARISLRLTDGFVVRHPGLVHQLLVTARRSERDAGGRSDARGRSRWASPPPTR